MTPKLVVSRETRKRLAAKKAKILRSKIPADELEKAWELFAAHLAGGVTRAEDRELIIRESLAAAKDFFDTVDKLEKEGARERNYATKEKFYKPQKSLL